MSRPRRLGVAAAVIDGSLLPGDVLVDDGRVSDVGVTPAGPGGLAVPGFVDLQVNGWGGIDLRSAEVDGYRTVGAMLAERGTTAWLPTIPTAAVDTTRRALSAAAGLCGDSAPGATPLGVHLEGPFLSPQRAGAHPPHHLLPIDPDLMELYRSIAAVRMVTLAPELDGALDLITRLTADGVTVSVGHCNADVVTAHAAFDAGARAHTHVWNAQRPVTARDPGSGGVALSRSDVAPMVIADLVHVAPEVLALTTAASSERYVVVSDASSAAGLAVGTHTIGTTEMTVGDGAVRLADNTLAGSATGLDGAIRNLVELGRPLLEAVAAATSRPAELIGTRGHGVLRVGGRADVAVLDDNLGLARVYLGGVPIG